MNLTSNETSHGTIKHLGTADTYIVGLSYVIFGILGLVGNASILIIISTSRVHRQRLSGMFLTNLAIADFLVCMTATPYYVTSLMLKPHLHKDHDPMKSEYNTVCKLPIFFNYFTASLRILSLAAMSIDRYLAINHPYFYARYCSYDVSRIRGFLAVIFLWIQGIVSLIPAVVSNKIIVFFGSNGRLCAVMWSESTFSYVVITILINFVIPAIVIFFTNCKVFWLARKQVVRERIKKQRASRTFQISNFRRRLAINKEEQQYNEDKKLNRISISFDKNQTTNREQNAVINNQHKISSNDKNTLALPNLSLQKNLMKKDNSSLSPGPKTQINLAISNDEDEKDTTFQELQGQMSVSSNNLQVPSIRTLHQINSTSKSEYTVEEDWNSEEKVRPKKRERKSRTSSDWEIALSTLALVVFYFISYLPFMSTRLLTSLTEGTLPVQVIAYTTLLTTLDSAINPLIVLKTRKEFRKVLKKKLCCKNFVDTDASVWSTVKEVTKN